MASAHVSHSLRLLYVSLVALEDLLPALVDMDAAGELADHERDTLRLRYLAVRLAADQVFRTRCPGCPVGL